MWRRQHKNSPLGGTGGGRDGYVGENVKVGRGGLSRGFLRRGGSGGGSGPGNSKETVLCRVLTITEQSKSKAIEYGIILI